MKQKKIRLWTAHNKENMRKMKWNRRKEEKKKRRRKYWCWNAILIQDWGLKVEIYLGEKEKDTRRLKSKDKVIKSEGEHVLKKFEEWEWHFANENLGVPEENKYSYTRYQCRTIVIDITALERTHSFRIEERTESNHESINLTLKIRKETI